MSIALKFHAARHRDKYSGENLDVVPIFAYEKSGFLWTKIKSSENGLITHIHPGEIYFLMMPEQEWARDRLAQLVNNWEDKFNDKNALFRSEIQYPLSTSSLDGELNIDSGTHVPELRIPTYEKYLDELRNHALMASDEYDFEDSCKNCRQKEKLKNIKEGDLGDELDVFRSVLFDYSRFTSLRQALSRRPW